MDEEVIKHIRSTLGDRITALRRKTGLSQEKFAFAAGIDRSNYAKIEQGKNNVRLETLCKISHYLKIDIKELFEIPN